jgi:ketosteroid isomerase-like protein
MSEGNLELVRRFFDLAVDNDLRHGDWPHLDLLAEDVIYHPAAQMAEARPCRGRDQFRRLTEDFYLHGWSDDLTWEPTSFKAFGDHVIVRVEFAGHGRASGAQFSGRVFAVYTVRDGEIVRVEDFVDRAEALGAVGFSE